jgi:phosphoglycerate dehydrogenase-like enzyme
MFLEQAAFNCSIAVYSPIAPVGFWTETCPSGLPPIKHTLVDTVDELLALSDVVSLHCPLFESNRNMISKRQFKIMKKTSVLINSARGGLVSLVKSVMS